jgi:formylglycine-generating enzyme required for sulfatase activity
VPVLDRLGLSLPSEAQWENGCRAGTSTAWWSGAEQESLQGVANLSDAYGRSHGNSSWSTWESWLDDGQSVHAEVGGYQPNAFGLHDTHGNVWEWCRDGYDGKFYARSPEQDPFSGPSGDRIRVLRGGSFLNAASVARAAYRLNYTPDIRGGIIGVRPAKGITP